MKTTQLILIVLVISLELSACTTKTQISLADITHEYRLRLVPTFQKPVELLIQHDAAGVTILSEYSYSGMGGYSPQRKANPKVIAITEERWDAFLTAFHKHKPWSIPETKPDQIGCDGTSVLLEMKEGMRRRTIGRWVPWAFVSDANLVKSMNEIIKLSPRQQLHADWLATKSH